MSLKGEVKIEMSGEEYTLCFDWSALAVLKEKYTDENIDAVVNGKDLSGLADIVAVGS